MPDIKISDAAPIGTLEATDMIPIARSGSDVAFNASLQDVADYIILLASDEAPPASSGTGTPGLSQLYARADHVHPYPDPIDSPTLTGTPTAPTPPLNDNSALIVNSSWVMRQLGALPPSAPLGSPNFTGIPTAPQAPIDNDTNQLANCAFVLGQASTVAPLMSSSQPTAGVSTRFSRGDHVHLADSSLAPLMSPQFTGNPTAPTVAPDTDTAALATAQFVLGQAAITIPLVDSTSPAPGTSFRYARADHVHPLPSPGGPASGYLGGTYPAPIVNRVKGVTDGSNAIAGDVGEFLGVQTLSSNAVALPSGVDTVIATLSLTPGDWEVWGSIGFTMTSNNNTLLNVWLNPGGTTRPSIDQMGGNLLFPVANNTAQVIQPIAPLRVSSANPINVALGSSSTTGGGTLTGWGKIMARRRR
jgi:hypothetical protein